MSAPAEHAKVLVVEDDPDIRRILELFLSERDFTVTTADSAERALDLLAAAPVDLILSDVRMPGMSGIELLHHIKAQDPDVQLVLMTAYSSVKDAVEAIQARRHRLHREADRLPPARAHPRRRLRAPRLSSEHEILQQRLQGRIAFQGMVARSQEMLEIFAFIERLARYPTTALITGESGTGKELVARALHDAQRRARSPASSSATAPPSPRRCSRASSSATCAARSPAPTATARASSRPRTAARIFLDEIGELPLAVQAKLLRVLENREIERVGSPEPHPYRHPRHRGHQPRPRARWSTAASFREDLYYRLNVGAISLPPLRSRADDIEPLVHHFVDIFNQRLGRSVTGIAPEVLGIVTRYLWPGNVRELANVIERAMVVCKSSVIVPESLPPHLFEVRPSLVADVPEMPDLSLQAAERDQILRALQASGGKRVEAARRLGLSRRTLYRKLSRYGIS